MSPYTGINHLAMVTGNMDETIRFWRDLLKMRLIAGLGGKGYRHYFFEISQNDMIAFFEWSGVEPLPLKDHGLPAKGPFAFDHIAFGVEDDEDLWDLKARIETAGYWVSEVIDHGFIHSIYTFDPNNIPIEFSSTVPGVDLRQTPKMMDRNPCQSAQEGPQPQPGKWPAPAHSIPPDDRLIYPGEGIILTDDEDRADGSEGAPINQNGKKEVR
jgi:catechol 2,3-dioxygenase-like lactoylglutathione lyase family enzyme